MILETGVRVWMDGIGMGMILVKALYDKRGIF